MEIVKETIIAHDFVEWRNELQRAKDEGHPTTFVSASRAESDDRIIVRIG